MPKQSPTRRDCIITIPPIVRPKAKVPKIKNRYLMKVGHKKNGYSLSKKQKIATNRLSKRSAIDPRNKRLIILAPVVILTALAGAAKAVSVTTGASIISRLFLGSIADRFDKRFVAIFCFLLQGIAVLFMAHFHQVAVLYLGTFAFGLTMGGIVMMQSLLVGDCFAWSPSARLSVFPGCSPNWGLFGPTIAGLIFDATQDYRIAFTIFGMTSLSAIVAIFFARPPKVLRGVPLYAGTKKTS